MAFSDDDDRQEAVNPNFGPARRPGAGVNPPALAETVIGNCTTSPPSKFDFDPKDGGHTIIFAPTRTGMSDS